jgi:dipeptidyl aminopeptidase/acylaminoacyl peptidase
MTPAAFPASRPRSLAHCVLLPVLALLLPVLPAALQAQERRAIDHEVYEIWRTIGSRALSADGNWVHYTLDLENDDGELVVVHATSGEEVRVPRGAQPTFTRDAAHALFTIRPTREAREAARGNRNTPAPADTLGILTLATGDLVKVPGVQGWRIPDEAGGWVAYHLTTTASREGEEGDAPPHGTLVVRNLASGEEVQRPAATSYAWADEGVLLAAVDSLVTDEGGTALRTWSPADGWVTAFETPGTIRSVSMTDAGDQLAFLHAPPAPTREEGAEEEGEAEDAAPRPWTVHRWTGGDAAPTLVAEAGTPGIPEGWTVSENQGPSFSDDGRRLFFGTVPPAPAPAELSDLESEVDVEIWHWLDAELMTVQNVRVNQERRRSFEAVAHLDDGGRVVQLADLSLTQVQVPDGGTAPLGLGRDTERYGIEGSWESPNFSDVYLVDLDTGERTLFLERSQGFPSLSPGGEYLTWYQPSDSTWYAHELASGEVRNLSDMVPHPLWNERNDSPSPPGSYGSAGWLEGDRAILLYDQFDLWALDPSGASAPRSITGEAGRASDTRYRVVRLESGNDPWSASDPVLLSTFHLYTKDAGFARTRLDASTAPATLLTEARNFSNPVKAEDADRILFTQETFQEFPDLWVARPDFTERRQVSDANPQQDEYRWGTAELMEWTSADGIPLQGVLMKPENFDPTRQYPMVVYFYERWSDGLHDHYALVPHRSRIAFPMYTSNDYVVFIPDIVYRNGYPGEGGLNAVNPGIFKLIEAGFVDRERIALQGHSWGGYQIAYMVTRSEKLYRAAAAGAPVANMTSAYGGIRRQTGLVRQFQYERTQSRLGGSLWDMPLRYIENSPLFWVDKIETPLLIMHNDSDGHVPWEQGIELFVAMRRLGKPAWMVNYRGEPHWPTTFANRVDWNVRMKQFFDHFLKDAPAPAWLVDGIPAVRRGETLGYEAVPGVSVVDDRYEGKR